MQELIRLSIPSLSFLMMSGLTRKGQAMLIRLEYALSITLLATERELMRLVEHRGTKNRIRELEPTGRKDEGVPGDRCGYGRDPTLVPSYACSDEVDPGLLQRHH